MLTATVHPSSILRAPDDDTRRREMAAFVDDLRTVAKKLAEIRRVTSALMQEGSSKAIIAAFFANAGIAVAKFVGFLLTGAASMLAESVHSFADTSNQGLLLLGGNRARKTADAEHPFGYGRERYFWSFVVALVIFSLGWLFALYEGIEKLRHPHEMESVPIAVGILLVAITLETSPSAPPSRRATTSRATSRGGVHPPGQVPELPVVLLEDIGAQVGLVLALVGLGLAEITGNARLDAVGTIAIGVLLVVIAVILVIEMKGLLIGEARHAGDGRPRSAPPCRPIRASNG